MKAKIYKEADDVFQKVDKQIGRAIVKKWLLQEREYRCQKCGNSGEWQGEPLALELEHINGDSLDNTRENLLILCPNCHSQTSTFRGRKIK
jgi:5-methylcytosine-specific restriction endonuclease McrA